MQKTSPWRAVRALAFTLGLAGQMAAASADDEPWLRCRAISDGNARLACYDAVKPRTAATTAATGTPAAAAAAAPAVPAAPTATPAQRLFGLERQQAEAADALESRLAGNFEGWGPRTRFQLANGQVWQVVDGSSAFYQLRDPAVKIRRASMGSFLMDIQGVNQVIRVRRVE